MADIDTKKEKTAGSPGSVHMIAAMGGVGLMAAVLLVFTYQITYPYIERNRAAYLEQAIFEVIPAAATRTTFIRTQDDQFIPAESEDETGFRVYAGYNDADELIGIAVEAQGQAFADVLRIIYGYAPACDCIVGMKVLESKETPGLGDKIEKDADFRANFDALDVQLSADEQQLLNSVELVKEGEKTDTWQIEAITGATISSRAIANIINGSASEIVPLIRRNLSNFQRSE